MNFGLLKENSSIFPVANWMSTSENLLKLSSSIPAKKVLNNEPVAKKSMLI